MTIAQPANRLLLGFLLSTIALLTACGVGNRPTLPDTTPVETSDFAYFGLANAPNAPDSDGAVTLSHDFLNVNGNRISTAGFTEFNTPPTICTIDGCVAQADAGTTGNGYAYYIAEDANGNPAYSYAGILATTNLGEPLRSFAAPAAYWRGEWSLNGLDPDYNDPEDDFYLEIFYNERVIRGPSAQNNILGRRGGVAGVKIIDGVPHELTVFAFYSEAGVILNGQADLTRSNVLYNGFLIGLVGSEGAVGAFRSSDPDLSYAGGFVVSPPTR